MSETTLHQPWPRIGPLPLLCCVLACGPGGPADDTDAASTTTGASTTALPTGSPDTTAMPTTASPATTMAATGSSTIGEPAGPTTFMTGSTSTGEDTSDSTSQETLSGGSSSTGDDSTGDDSEEEDLCAGLVTFKGMGKGDVMFYVLETPEDKLELAGVECFDGDLALFPGIGDASGLEAMRVITGRVLVTSELPKPPPQAIFQGFDNLEYMGTLELFDAAVSTFAGLESLHTLGFLRVIEDAFLQDFTGLDNLETLGSLAIGRCIEGSPVPIQSMAGLENLTTVTGYIVIASHKLVDFNLPALETVHELILCKGLSLTSVSLPLITELYSLEIADQELWYPPLVSLEIPKLETIDHNLWLIGTQLVNLSGLSTLKAVGGSLEIVDNKQLPTCTAKAFAAQFNPAGSVSISGNLPDACDN